ncbi:MAG TPA: M56 family metallopeptidase [Hanamia sp.]
MISYIFKTILCSGLLYLIFILFLEKEKMHRFNRFYLLFSIAFSFAVPLLVFKTNTPVIPVSKIINTIPDNFNNIIYQPASPSINETNYFPIFLWIFYVAITVFLLYRFFKNILVIFFKIQNARTIPYFDAKLVLTHDNLIPHSFLKYIFIDKKDFEKKTIEKEILTHELAHTKQKHTIDILLIELLLVFVWFNPFLYLYKRSIKLNHEFLADENVVNTFRDTHRYQHLLLNKVRQANSLLLSSPFNYLITKKRLIMLTKSTSVRVSILKKIALIPFFAATAFIFSTNAIAQNTSKVTQQEQEQQQKDSTPNAIVGISPGSTRSGVSKELLNEYQSIIHKYKTDKNPAQYFFQKITPTDKNRMERIYTQMSKKQQKMQTVTFIKPPLPLPRITPTKAQMESFKNLAIYRVWINKKKVSNTILNNYTNTDFSQVFVSILYGAAKTNVNYLLQVDLMTKDYYQKYYDDKIANKDKDNMLFISDVSIKKMKGFK